MLLAAVALLIAATALLKVEASNDAVAAIVASRDKPSLGDSPIDPGNTLTPFIKQFLVAVGISAAIVCIGFAQRAWRGWSGSSPEVWGVALSALLAMAAGVVGIFLVAAL
jgi:hypothetical protein